MKTLEVVSKMAFLVFKKCKFPRIFCKIPAKTQFSEIILKIYLTNRKNAFEKVNHINFVTWAVTQNPNFQVLFNLWPVRRLNTLILAVNFFSQIGLRFWIMCLKTEVLPKISKKWKMNQKSLFWIRQKSALFIAVSEEIRTVQPWISAVSVKISADS